MFTIPKLCLPKWYLSKMSVKQGKHSLVCTLEDCQGICLSTSRPLPRPWSQPSRTQTSSSHTVTFAQSEADCERCSKGRLEKCLWWNWGHQLRAEVLSWAKCCHSYHPGEKQCLQNHWYKIMFKNFRYLDQRDGLVGLALTDNRGIFLAP